MIFIGYEDNGYRFIHHTQENIIFYSTQAIFDKEHFPRCSSSHPREQMSPGRLTLEIESLVPGSSGVDKPTPTPFPPIPAHSRSFTPLIPSNLPTHSESPSLFLLLIPPKQSSVKIEEVEDVEDEDVEMHFPSPSLPKAGPVMNIKWDYSYYQPWSDNKWLVDEMIAMQEETLIVQNEDITMQ